MKIKLLLALFSLTMINCDDFEAEDFNELQQNQVTTAKLPTMTAINIFNPDSEGPNSFSTPILNHATFGQVDIKTEKQYKIFLVKSSVGISKKLIKSGVGSSLYETNLLEGFYSIRVELEDSKNSTIKMTFDNRVISQELPNLPFP
jgi:hypothetical protein